MKNIKNTIIENKTLIISYSCIIAVAVVASYFLGRKSMLDTIVDMNK